MKDKKMAFIGEAENGYIVEVPSTGKRWVFANFKEAMDKTEELMGDVKPTVSRPEPV